VRANGIIALTSDPGDDVLGVDLSDGTSEIFMATSKGKADSASKKPTSRPWPQRARVIGIRMAEDDRLVEMEVLSGKPTSSSV
jgi:DNA gyrase subunit A